MYQTINPVSNNRFLGPFYTYVFSFFLNDTATTEIYTLSLHDALPIYAGVVDSQATIVDGDRAVLYVWYDNEFGYSCQVIRVAEDRKSTRLNSSHVRISYAVFCLKKKRLL